MASAGRDLDGGLVGLIRPTSAAIDHDLVPGVSGCRSVLRKRLLHLEQVAHGGNRVHWL